MLFSVYPTQTAPERADVVENAAAHAQSDGAMLFTSLHIPEAEGLAGYGGWMAGVHARTGLEFCADISPVTLGKLGCAIDELGRLRHWGVRMLRIDCGFSADEVREIAASGDYAIAINASSATADFIDAFCDIELVGWHNYYPRPETGITVEYFRAQSALFAQRGLPVYSFIPGERSFRAPLHLGMPMLEHQRFRNAYVNLVEVATLWPGSQVVCAEGTLYPRHQRWIERFEREHVLTIPLVGVDPSVDFLFGRDWTLRAEQTDAAWRLDGSRQARTPSMVINADVRARGSVQMDLEGYGRYCGEINLMKHDRPLNHLQARVADIAAPYVDLVDAMAPGTPLRFVRWEACDAEGAGQDD
ncbi:MAG: MupG family TIM beta-alpha barrel fold protein [Propionibacteriaceae bacterium]|nr:MupG family TIM beta-alpha barrel fold protein [Propionibacteriaceae bacterium]